MLEIVAEQMAFCALIGFALSIVVAMAAHQPVRVEVKSILPRLILAGVPVYLAVAYLVDQGSMMCLVAAGVFVACLSCLRGWWLPQPDSAVVERRRPTVRSHQAEVLRFRIETVVRADRGYRHGSAEGRRAKVA
jgi:hypothetical protein